MCTQCSRCSGTGVTSSCQLPRGCWESTGNPALQQEVRNSCAISPTLRNWILKDTFHTPALLLAGALSSLSTKAERSSASFCRPMGKRPHSSRLLPHGLDWQVTAHVFLCVDMVLLNLKGNTLKTGAESTPESLAPVRAAPLEDGSWVRASGFVHSVG